MLLQFEKSLSEMMIFILHWKLFSSNHTNEWFIRSKMFSFTFFFSLFTLNQYPKTHVIALVRKMNQSQNQLYAEIHELNVAYLPDSIVRLVDDAVNLDVRPYDAILIVEIHLVWDAFSAHVYIRNNKLANK